MPEAQEQTQPKPLSLAEWKKRAVHTVTLWSGAVVSIKIPDLPQMVKAGQIPNNLVDAAIGVAGGKKPTRDDIEEQADFFNKLCAETVVAPKVTEEDFAAGVLPFEDKEMLVEFATRQRDMDAVNKHIGGLETVESFRVPRGLPSEFPNLEDL